MRKSLALLLIVAWCIPSAASAQIKEKFLPPKIEKVQVGFRTYRKEDDQTAYKVGLWTPIYIEVFGGTDGIAPTPTKEAYLKIETSDSEDVGTTVAMDCLVEPLKERVFVSYVKTGHFTQMSHGVKVTLHIGSRELKARDHDLSFNLNMDAHLYLTLGPRITEFHNAVSRMGRQVGDKEDPNNPRLDNNVGHTVVYEGDVKRLPTRWFGYNSVDLLVLSDNRDFLTKLSRDDSRAQLSALAQWVRRGGRLVVPISAASQDVMHALLKNEAAWQPAIPVVPPKVSANLQLEQLVAVQRWRNIQADPFARKGGLIPVATLDPGKVAPGDWDISARDTDEATGFAPLIAHVRYGLGQITYMAFSLQDDHFAAWAGREKFMQAMVTHLAPKAPKAFNPEVRFGRGDDGMSDLSTQMLAELEKFGVTPIEFGYVALFIILYILVVGPLDFVVLKYVFKRLEWTWITFPAVVLAVSVIAYFAAYALKGKDLKINKVDIVDFDLRTSPDPRQTRAYGHTFFAILSPRIQNYTVGLEPNPQFWGAEPKKIAMRNDKQVDETLSVDLLSWLGRPTGGMNDMGRGGSGGFFRKPYQYREDFSALEGVPIPVWTTKAFTASWEQHLADAPFKAELIYHQKLFQGQELKISGILENHLGVDLVDAWLYYGNNFYLLEGGLKSVKNGAAPIKVAVTRDSSRSVLQWVGENAARDDAPPDSAGNAQQTRLMKQILVHEKFDNVHSIRNHLLRPIDLSWRSKEEDLGAQHDRSTREVILIARVRYPAGPAEALTSNAMKPLPTKLWLGDIPETGRTRPALSGQLNQDTYVRVILPVRPAD